MIDLKRLRCSALFAELADADLEQWAAAFEETDFLLGSNIAKEGEFAYRFYVVLEGEVSVLHDFDEIARLGPGEFFGEMGVMTGGRRNARVVAQTRCDLASMVAWDFQRLTEAFPDVARKIDEQVAKRVAALPDA